MTLEKIVQYLTDNGMDESEVDYFLKSRIFRGKSILDLIRDGLPESAWYYVKTYMNGDTWE